MRKRPVLPMLFRRAVKDVRIGPYLFPQGTIIEIHVLAMNTHPLYWDRPDDFLPVRSDAEDHLQKSKHVHVCPSASDQPCLQYLNVQASA